MLLTNYYRGQFTRHVMASFYTELLYSKLWLICLQDNSTLWFNLPLFWLPTCLPAALFPTPTPNQLLIIAHHWIIYHYFSSPWSDEMTSFLHLCCKIPWFSWVLRGFKIAVSKNQLQKRLIRAFHVAESAPFSSSCGLAKHCFTMLVWY